MRNSDLLSINPLNTSGSYTMDDYAYASSVGTIPSANSVVVLSDNADWMYPGKENTTPYAPKVVFNGAISEAYLNHAQNSTYGSYGFKSGGTVYINQQSMSYGFNGQLPIIGSFVALTDAATAACGYSMSAYVSKTGKLYTCGSPTGGQLGNNSTTTTQSSYVQIGTDTNWAKVWCMYQKCIAIKTDGTLWFWGANQYGPSAGTGNTLIPTQVGTDTNWSNAYVQYNGAFLTKTDGTLWSFGNLSYNGWRGVNTTTALALGQVTYYRTWKNISVAGTTHTVAVSSYGELIYNGNGIGTKFPVGFGIIYDSGIADAATNGYGVYYLKTTGELYFYGPKNKGAGGNVSTVGEYFLGKIPPTSKMYTAFPNLSNYTLMVSLQ